MFHVLNKHESEYTTQCAPFTFNSESGSDRSRSPSPSPPVRKSVSAKKSSSAPRPPSFERKKEPASGGGISAVFDPFADVETTASTSQPAVVATTTPAAPTSLIDDIFSAPVVSTTAPSPAGAPQPNFPAGTTDFFQPTAVITPGTVSADDEGMSFLLAIACLAWLEWGDFASARMANLSVDEKSQTKEDPDPDPWKKKNLVDLDNLIAPASKSKNSPDARRNKTPMGAMASSKPKPSPTKQPMSNLQTTMPTMMQPPTMMQQPGMMQPGMMQTGMMQPGMVMQQPGMMQPGMMVQPGMMSQAPMMYAAQPMMNTMATQPGMQPKWS